jgi:hypothetical protein
LVPGALSSSSLNNSRLCKIYNKYEDAICKKGRVLLDRLGLNQWFVDWKNPPPIPDQLSNVLHQQLKNIMHLEKGMAQQLNLEKGCSLMQHCESPPTLLLVSALSGWFLMRGSSCGILV